MAVDWCDKARVSWQSFGMRGCRIGRLGTRRRLKTRVVPGLWVFGVAVTLSCGGRIAPEPADTAGGVSSGGNLAERSDATAFTSGGAVARATDEPGFALGGAVARATGATGATDTDGGPGAVPPCPSQWEVRRGDRCVAQMASVVTSGNAFQIDMTEVTRSQYESWLSSNPDLTQQAPMCASNATYAPYPSCMDKPSVCHGECANHPQVCIDWCDAYAYCRDAGKRLCGRIGGGSNDFNQHSNATQSQWYAACSSGGNHAFPYEGAYQPKNCNGYDFWGRSTDYSTVEVGSLSACRAAGLSEPVFDLSGNVYEWEDSCTVAGGSSFCRLRGGAYHKGSDCMGCADVGEDLVEATFVVVGFRCCSL